MNKLSFSYWMMHEMANYGFDTASNEIMGGTEPMTGDSLFQHIRPNKIMNELLEMPKVGTYEGQLIFNDGIQWGNESGAFMVEMSPYGSMRVVARRLTKDLKEIGRAHV